MYTRREFMGWLAASLCVPPMVMTEAQASEPGLSTAATGSDVGSLYPFIESQAVKGGFPSAKVKSCCSEGESPSSLGQKPQSLERKN